MSKQLAAWQGNLHRKGYRLTAARRAILQALADSGGHVTADELVTLVRKTSSGVGRMTVYRTLELLSELGIIHPVYQGTGAAHYILMEHGRHHHLICSTCHKVIEFDDCVLTEIEQMASSRFHFQVESHLLELYGRCPDCQKVKD